MLCPDSDFPIRHFEESPSLVDFDNLVCAPFEHLVNLLDLLTTSLQQFLTVVTRQIVLLVPVLKRIGRWPPLGSTAPYAFLSRHSCG